MTFYSVSNPFMQVLNLQGTGLNDGDVYFGVAGQDPITHPINVYWDLAGTQLAPQPIETTGGYLYRAGTPAAVYLDSTYSIKVLDKNGATVYYQANVFDPVFQVAADLAAFEASLAGATGSSLVGYSGGISGAAATTVQARLREYKSLKADFGAVGDGVADDTAAFQRARIYAAGAGGAVTIFCPDGTYNITGAVGVIPAGTCWQGSSAGGCIFNISYDGPTFTHQGYAGDYQNIQFKYPSAPGANAVVILQDGGTGQRLINCRVDNVRTLLQCGTSGGSLGGALTINNLVGNAYNGGSPFISLWGGAGLFINSVEAYVAGVGNPTVDRTSTMTTVSGTSFIKNNGPGWDTIDISGSNILERWWRVLDFTTTVAGGNILNVFVWSMTADYISNDVYHLEAPAGAASIVTVKLHGYAASWSGRCVYIKAASSVKFVDLNNMFFPFSGYEGIRLEGTGWSYVNIDMPVVIASNRIAAGASAGIRAQDSGTGHLSIIQAITGIDGASGGTAWQATYGLSIGADIPVYQLADCDSAGTVGAYDIAANATASGNRRVRDNLNSDYYGIKTGTAPYIDPGSATPWVNKTPFVVQFSAQGGGITSMQHNGTTVTTNSAVVIVQPGETAGYNGAGTVQFFVEP